MKFGTVLAIFLAVGMPVGCAQHSRNTAPERPHQELDGYSAGIWNDHIREQPSGRIMDNWELVEGLMLCQEVGEIDNFSAAFATVAKAGVGELAISEKRLIVLAQDIKGDALSEDEREDVRALWVDIREHYGDRPVAPFYKGTPFKGYVRAHFVPVLRGCSGVDEAVKCLHRKAGWTAVVERGENVPFTNYKESIDKGLAPLVKRDGRYMPVVGYIVVKGEPHLIIAHLDSVPIELVAESYSEREHTYFKSLPPDDLARMRYERSLKRKDIKMDPTVNSNEPLMRGVKIEQFDPKMYEVIFIHGWRKSAEAWTPEIAEIVGQEN